MKIITFCGLLVCSSVFAQSGNYVGSLTLSNEPQFAVVVNITNNEAGRLQGTIRNYRPGACMTQARDAEGVIEGKEIRIRTVEIDDDTYRECDNRNFLSFHGMVEGENLVGKAFYGGKLYDLTLTKPAVKTTVIPPPRVSRAEDRPRTIQPTKLTPTPSTGRPPCSSEDRLLELELMQLCEPFPLPAKNKQATGK